MAFELETAAVLPGGRRSELPACRRLVDEARRGDRQAPRLHGRSKVSSSAAATWDEHGEIVWNVREL